MKGIDFKGELNEQQYEVVTAGDGPILVIAAAGTGKTRALTYRVAYLVDEKEIEPARILLLTFTNKASREMLERAERLVGERVGGLWGGTFHHMANRMLRRHGRVLDYAPDYTILDQDDSRTLIKSSMEDFNLVGKEFPKSDVLGGIFSLAANRNIQVQTVAEERFHEHDLEIQDVLRVYKRYVEKKRDLNAMDFDDLLVNGLRLFLEDELVLNRYQDLFQYILVDEYQDTNVIQSAWVDALAKGHNNALVVGDDFQSIYSWRGADFRNIMTFPERYVDAQVFKLVLNYRSSPEILNVANACIAGNPDQFQKTLIAHRESYKKPFFIRPQDGNAQARFIVEHLIRLRSEGYAWEDLAVLYRAHFHAMELQLQLMRQEIPYVVTSGIRFFEQAHIKDVCAPVRLAVNPGDELAFRRMAMLLPRLGAKTAARIWSRIGKRFPLTDVRSLIGMRNMMPAGAQQAWHSFEEIFCDVVRENLQEDPGEIIHRFVEAFYDRYAVQTFENYDQRMPDIRALIDFASGYETAAYFVNDMALLTNMDTSTQNAQGEASKGVRLSSVHQAKGLEWSVVFVPWLNEGSFPSARSLADAGTEAEERRLFYEAATRAKDELYLCAPESRRTRDGGIQFPPPSRFVSEIPEELVQRYEISVF